MDLLIIITLLVIAAETTYLVARSGQFFGYRKYSNPIFVDTSVLIDGRILAVAQSGFITGTLLIPRSVVGELQLLADQADHDKRTRARRGLDLINELTALTTARVAIFPDESPAREGVDNRLLKLARKYRGAICTIDFNLNKVAQVEHIAVLNVNDLAMNLRMAYLPGEKLMLELTQKGNDSHQAVGHLTDGTMVVVEQASGKIGQRVEIEFIRSLQTAAGKMMFARLVNVAQPAPKKPAPIGQKKQPQQVQPQQQAAKPKPQRAEQQQQTRPVSKMSQPADETVRVERPKPQPRPQQAKPKTNNQRRRRTNEDSLVELANKIGE